MVQRKIETVLAEQIKPLNPEGLRETNQEYREDGIGADYTATLYISATRCVLMTSVGTNYKIMHQFHVVLDTESGLNVMGPDVFRLSWKRCLTRNTPLSNVVDASGNRCRGKKR